MPGCDRLAESQMLLLPNPQALKELELTPEQFIDLCILCGEPAAAAAAQSCLSMLRSGRRRRMQLCSTCPG